MRAIYFLIVLLLATGCGSDDKTKAKSSEQKSENKPENEGQTKTDYSGKKIFDIAAAKIVYNYSDGVSTGIETFYFDEYGNNAVLVEDKTGKMGRINKIIIWKDKRSTIIDHETKKVSKSPFRPKATEPPAIADTDDNTKKNIGYERLADEIVAGKTCEVWENKKRNIKYWLWNKVELKISNQGTYAKEATSVDEIPIIPPSLFEIPKDYKQ